MEVALFKENHEYMKTLHQRTAKVKSISSRNKRHDSDKENIQNQGDKKIKSKDHKNICPIKSAKKVQIFEDKNNIQELIDERTPLKELTIVIQNLCKHPKYKDIIVNLPLNNSLENDTNALLKMNFNSESTEGFLQSIFQKQMHSAKEIFMQILSQLPLYKTTIMFKPWETRTFKLFSAELKGHNSLISTSSAIITSLRLNISLSIIKLQMMSKIKEKFYQFRINFPKSKTKKKKELMMIMAISVLRKYIKIKIVNTAYFARIFLFRWREKVARSIYKGFEYLQKLFICSLAENCSVGSFDLSPLGKLSKDLYIDLLRYDKKLGYWYSQDSSLSISENQETIISLDSGICESALNVDLPFQLIKNILGDSRLNKKSDMPSHSQYYLNQQHVSLLCIPIRSKCTQEIIGLLRAYKITSFENNLINVLRKFAYFLSEIIPKFSKTMEINKLKQEKIGELSKNCKEMNNRIKIKALTISALLNISKKNEIHDISEKIIKICESDTAEIFAVEGNRIKEIDKKEINNSQDIVQQCIQEGNSIEILRNEAQSYINRKLNKTIWIPVKSENGQVMRLVKIEKLISEEEKNIKWLAKLEGTQMEMIEQIVLSSLSVSEQKRRRYSSKFNCVDSLKMQKKVFSMLSHIIGRIMRRTLISLICQPVLAYKQIKVFEILIIYIIAPILKITCNYWNFKTAFKNKCVILFNKFRKLN